MAEAAFETVSLSIGGSTYAGWTGVRISRSLDALTGSFETTLVRRDRTGDSPRAFQALADCAVMVSGEQLIAGVIDRVSVRHDARAHAITVAGRDRAAALVDCSAIVKPGSWRGARFEAIVRELVAPFGIAVRFTAPTGGPIKRFAIQQGETVHEAIERLCRFRALVAWSEADGSIVIGNPASGALVGRLVEGEHPVQLSVDHDASQRYSDYVVKGQSSGDDDANGRTVAQLSATARDPAVPSYRPLVIIAEEQSDLASLKKRADWEANVRAARAQTVTVALQGWRNPQGGLWAPGQRVHLVAPSLAVDLDLLVVAVELSRDRAGTIAMLDLQRPEAWQQLAVPEDADATSLERQAA